MDTQIEYRVRPVTRFIVTRYETELPRGGATSAGRSSQHGEFENEPMAYAVGYALARAEHDRLGYPPGDPRIGYPEVAAETAAPSFAEVVPGGAVVPGEWLQALGDDAMKWASAFCNRFPAVPQDVALGWFANAIEHSSDVRRSRLVRDAQAWADFNEDIATSRRLFRDIDVRFGEGRVRDGDDGADWARRAHETTLARRSSGRAAEIQPVTEG